MPSKIDLNKLRQKGLKELFATLEEAFKQADIDFYYLIGALARDIWFSKESKVSRTTRDVDFAALVAGKEQFDRVKAILKADHGFSEVKGNAFALTSREGTTIDILPFGAIAVNDGVTVEGMGLHAIRVNGFKEVATAGVSQVEIAGSTYHVATLPAIVLLKLIAYDDRPESRINDPGDIALIILNYFDIEMDLFYDRHFDLLERIEEGRDVIAARVIGRSIRDITESNSQLKHRICGILQTHIQQPDRNPFVLKMATTIHGTIESSVTLLREMLSGIAG